MATQYLMHVVPTKIWEQAKVKGEYRPDSLQAEGFVHLSTEDQVVTVANRFFKGHRGLSLLYIDPEKLKFPVKFESVSDSPEKYPHLYGPLNVEAVVRVRPLEAGMDGIFISLPS